MQHPNSYKTFKRLAKYRCLEDGSFVIVRETCEDAVNDFSEVFLKELFKNMLTLCSHASTFIVWGS